MKKSYVILLAAALCLSLASCASGDSSGGAETTTAAEVSQPAPAQEGADPDMAGFLFKGGSESCFGLTIEEISEKTGGFYSLETAADGDLEWGLEFDLGQRDSLMGGRFKLGGTYTTRCTLFFKDQKLSSVWYGIEGGEDAVPVTEALKTSIEADILEDYSPEYDRPALGKNSATYFNGDIEGYLIQMFCSKLDDSGFPITIKLESYRSAYGL
ncbi:MAG: hypothetical protein IJ746_07895 [Ruminococcus sp.]|nr:hypothetical protein [Ruminococcus sp.]